LGFFLLIKRSETKLPIHKWEEKNESFAVAGPPLRCAAPAGQGGCPQR